MSELRFDGRVAVVTGAGRGVGRGHALLLAARGAKVVVADYGASLAGSGASAAPGEEVVREIEAAGGEAAACFASVAEEDGAASIIETALGRFGRVDIVINNAGISDKHYFEDLSVEQFRQMIDVHYLGTLHVTRAAWPHLAAAGYGRIVNTTSEGILGPIDRLTSYGAAKGAVLGLTKTLAVEGLAKGIRVNAVAPRAYTRMAEAGRPPLDPESEAGKIYQAVLDRLDPALVAPAAAYLAHESCTLSGEVLIAGGGEVHRMAFAVTKGIFEPNLTVEDVAERVAEITDFTDAQPVEIAR
jgi:NAD(P)-dependent dehydrogenase (short-subunit alcohol dehydrogenase family)